MTAARDLECPWTVKLVRWFVLLPVIANILFIGAHLVLALYDESLFELFLWCVIALVFGLFDLAAFVLIGGFDTPGNDWARVFYGLFMLVVISSLAALQHKYPVGATFAIACSLLSVILLNLPRSKLWFKASAP